MVLYTQPHHSPYKAGWYESAEQQKEKVLRIFARLLHTHERNITPYATLLHKKGWHFPSSPPPSLLHWTDTYAMYELCNDRVHLHFHLGCESKSKLGKPPPVIWTPPYESWWWWWQRLLILDSEVGRDCQSCQHWHGGTIEPHAWQIHKWI